MISCDHDIDTSTQYAFASVGIWATCYFQDPFRSNSQLTQLQHFDTSLRVPSHENEGWFHRSSHLEILDPQCFRQLVQKGDHSIFSATYFCAADLVSIGIVSGVTSLPFHSSVQKRQKSSYPGWRPKSWFVFGLKIQKKKVEIISIAPLFKKYFRPMAQIKTGT